ncbi:hypothetical protein CLOM_g18921 [Closterium sp. NIES-68]|nr:hypothetical protein CLOM_g18921 [Closterium sp. NIES-68]
MHAHTQTRTTSRVQAIGLHQQAPNLRSRFHQLNINSFNFCNSSNKRNNSFSNSTRISSNKSNSNFRSSRSLLLDL